jgi:hypothetical protein
MQGVVEMMALAQRIAWITIRLLIKLTVLVCWTLPVLNYNWSQGRAEARWHATRGPGCSPDGYPGFTTLTSHPFREHPSGTLPPAATRWAQPPGGQSTPSATTHGDNQHRQD